MSFSKFVLSFTSLLSVLVGSQRQRLFDIAFTTLKITIEKQVTGRFVLSGSAVLDPHAALMYDLEVHEYHRCNICSGILQQNAIFFFIYLYIPFPIPLH